MKLGIITDIHSNVTALNVVLKEFEKIKVDKIICCGDIIGIGPNPEEVVQTLIQLKNKMIAVRGNHEQYLLEGLPKNVHDNKRGMSLKEIQNHQWTFSNVSKQSKEFLEKLPIEQNIQIQNQKIYIIHYPMDNDGKYKRYIKNSTPEEQEELFNEIDSDIFIYGHTHIPSIKKKDKKWYINTGSLGCPLNNHVSNAGVLEIEEDKISFKQLNIHYNVNKVIKRIKELKYPFYEEIIRIFYGNK